MVRWEAWGGSHRGKVREHNEDAYRIDVERGLFLVADGMGGHAAGEVASGLAVAAASDVLIAGGNGASSPNLHEAFRAVHASLAKRARKQPAISSLGTTLTVCCLHPEGDARIGHVGDSRAYLWRAGELRQLTHDHTWVQREVDEHRMSPEVAALDPRGHILIRSLGAEHWIDPDTFSVSMQARDRLLLVSDGLYDMLSCEEIAGALRAGEGLADVGTRLIHEANEGGGIDNVTVVLVEIQEGE